MTPPTDKAVCATTLLITGGSGFIGSALIRLLLTGTDVRVVNLDVMTYAASPDTLLSWQDHPRYRAEPVDIRDAAAVGEVFRRHDPDGVIHLAAESHVDRSIDHPAEFVATNVVGTTLLLEQALAHWSGLSDARRRAFRFLHVSTDEVFGSLDGDPGTGARFTETTPYAPRSPYAASKAAADHFVQAWHHTYGLPVLLSNCSNNYGPYQFPEKLIPLMILTALQERPLPVYGQGENIRDWLYVEDHARALWLIFTQGRIGARYTVGAEAERRNIDLVRLLCAALDALHPRPRGRHEDLITFVPDRPGHDLRYAIDPTRLRTDLGWQPVVTLEEGVRRTVAWYLENRAWWAPLLRNSASLARVGTRGAGVLPLASPPRA